MCGITGILDFNKRSGEDTLLRMTNTLNHRGPDGNGTFFSKNADFFLGLGHRRLSIIDLSNTGSQPMTSGNMHVTFNGEIYNYAEIRMDLQSLGHTFVSTSDTEVLLRSYIEWGSSCVSRFTGMFAFAIYDAEKQELFCARDRAGVKPFFYYWKDGLFLFASELKAFHVHPEFKKELHTDAVAAFLQYGNIPGDHCIFKNCHKLKPGHTLLLSLSSRNLHIKKYWNVYDAYNQPKLNISFGEAKLETEKKLSKAFAYRMISDVPVGVFLSGGYDSTCLTTLLQKDNSTKLKTYTIGVEDSGLDEAPYARAIAAHLGTEHQEYYFTRKDLIELVQLLPYYYDEPFADQSALPTTLVCRMARREVTVALSADAGDEVFAGYNRYDYLLKYGKILNSLPSFARKSIAGIMDMMPADSLPLVKGNYNFHNRYEKLKQLLKDPSPRNMMLSLSRQYDDAQLRELLAIPFLYLDTAYLSDELKEDYYSPLAYMMAIDYQTYLPDDILQKVDRASMSTSLEAREPFLDHTIIEWAARLPDSYKYSNGIKKYILKEIVHQYVPKQMMDRPKMGFAIPLEDWLMNELREQVRHYLSEDRLKSQNIFNVQSVKQLQTAFFSGRKELALKIWYILMFQMWYEKWMDSAV